MALAASLKDVMETEVAVLNLEKHPYFSGLLNGKISKEQFLQSQIQFAYLVRYFSRPMAAVVANIPNDIKRMAIVDNLWEEHGKGNADKIHGKTIVTLIERLGGDVAELKKNNVSPSIEIFNTALKGIATFEDYRVSASVFGGIERTFVDVSALICQAIVERGWLQADRITHYALHKELDIQHAEDFLSVVEDDWVSDPMVSQPMIRRGVRLGAALFTRVYSDFSAQIAHS